MLLIPLLLLWARAPMRFAGHWKTSLITVVTALALAAPWAGGGGGGGEAAPPTAAAADGRFGPAAASPPTAGQSDSRPGGSAKDAPPGLLREGTRVSATNGRFVLSGSRWNFVPDPSPAPTEPPQADGSAPGGSAKPLDSPSAKPNPAAGLARTSKSRDGDLERPGESAGTRRDNSPTLRRRTIVAENLMLQRVVEAIRADPDDDRWTVTGEVAEFFGENRLRLQTVQRASNR